MTNHFNDMANSDVIIACGGNNAENHPASMRHINAAREAGGKYIVVDPRFTRSAAIADMYAPIRSGTDITFFGALINYIMENDLWNKEYVVGYSNASWLIADSYDFEDGMFSGWTEDSEGNGKYDSKAWAYQVESTTPWDTAPGAAYAWTQAPGVPQFKTPAIPNVKKDPTLQDPQSVFQLMKKHYERYTPEMVENICGMPKKSFLEIAKILGETGADDKSATFLYAMGLTQHTKGSQNIRALSIIQLLLGNMGIAGGGVNALRGESNVQGSTDWGLLSDNLPGYLKVPNSVDHPTLADYNAKETPYAGYWSNKPKFLISMLKEYWGDTAVLENDFCYDYLPKIEQKNYTHISLFEAINEDVIKGLFLWGQNPAVGGPNANFERQGLAKLDFLVAVDLFETDSAAFWKLPIEDGSDPDPASINTEVFLLPAVAHLEKQGTVSNSGRWVQWRYKAVDAPGDALDDGQIFTMLYEGIKAEYEQGGEFPDPIVNLHWPYKNEEGHFDSTLAAAGMNGYTTKDGKLIENLTKLQADGSTACAGWIYSGYYNNNEDPRDPSIQPCGRRDTSDATVAGLSGGISQYPQWAWAWPMNRRVLYNRASTLKATGAARNPNRILVQWNGSNWDRNDVPDFGFQTAQPDGTNVGTPPDKCPPFFMNPELMGRIFAPGMKDGPFAEHYEPYESPVENKLSGTQRDPAALVYKTSSKFGDPEEFPILCTTFRVVEQWQTGVTTRNSPWLAQAMPNMFCEVSEELAEEKGIVNGDDIEVFNNRGNITVKAMVTKRMKPFDLDGQVVHQVAMPWHWGKLGIVTGASANDLVANVGDANTSIPESKAFLVDIKKKGA